MTLKPEDVDNVTLNEDDDLGLFGEGLDDPEPESKPADYNPDKDYKKKYIDAEKSRRHEQREYSKLQNEFKEIKNNFKTIQEQGEARNKKIMEAFGLKNSDDESAKKIIEQFNNDPISFINSSIDSKLNEKLPKLEKEVTFTKMVNTMKPIMENISSVYEVDFSPEFEKRVGKILENFDPKYRLSNPAEAILQATIIAKGAEGLKKRSDEAVYIEGGGKVRFGNKGAKSEAEKIRESFMSSKPKINDLFK